MLELLLSDKELTSEIAVIENLSLLYKEYGHVQVLCAVNSDSANIYNHLRNMMMRFFDKYDMDITLRLDMGDTYLIHQAIATIYKGDKAIVEYNNPNDMISFLSILKIDKAKYCELCMLVYNYHILEYVRHYAISMKKDYAANNARVEQRLLSNSIKSILTPYGLRFETVHLVTTREE